MSTKQVITVTTAHKLNSDQRSQLNREIKKKIGSSFELKEVVDTKVIGGIKIALGDKEFDITVSGKLKELASQINTVKIVTAVPLTVDQRKKIRDAISNKFGTLETEEVVDPSVIGGIKIRIGSNEFDGTLLSKIEKLRVQLKQQI